MSDLTATREQTQNHDLSVSQILIKGWGYLTLSIVSQYWRARRLNLAKVRLRESGLSSFCLTLDPVKAKNIATLCTAGRFYADDISYGPHMIPRQQFWQWNFENRLKRHWVRSKKTGTVDQNYFFFTIVIPPNISGAIDGTGKAKEQLWRGIYTHAQVSTDLTTFVT
jgi:hypothetical protein